MNFPSRKAALENSIGKYGNSSEGEGDGFGHHDISDNDNANYKEARMTKNNLLE